MRGATFIMVVYIMSEMGLLDSIISPADGFVPPGVMHYGVAKIKPHPIQQAQLAAKRRCGVKKQQIDMKEEYERFKKDMEQKGLKSDCNQERFYELSKNPDTGLTDIKSLTKAKGGLEGEARGLYTNLRRPSNKAVDLDFEIDSPNGYTQIDSKTPINFQDLVEQGKDISGFPDVESVAYNIGFDIPGQKNGFVMFLRVLKTLTKYSILLTWI